MIDRKIAMAILGALPEDKMLKALQVAGIAPHVPSVGMDSAAMAPMGSDSNKIQPWSQREVTYAGGQDRPALIDRMWAKPGLVNAQAPVQGGAMEGGDIYLQTGGM